jgi:hypothetical protein
VEMKVVQDMLGHSSITITSDTTPASCRRWPAARPRRRPDGAASPGVPSPGVPSPTAASPRFANTVDTRPGSMAPPTAPAQAAAGCKTQPAHGRQIGCPLAGVVQRGGRRHGQRRPVGGDGPSTAQRRRKPPLSVAGLAIASLLW